MSSPKDRAAIASLVHNARYEIVPLKNALEQAEHLPVGCEVSVTCSPAKGIPATLELTEHLLKMGFHAVPHFAARMVADAEQVADLAAWCRDHSLTEIFVVGGDAPEPVGVYTDAGGFLRDLLAADHRLSRIGVTAYPDGHSFIPTPALNEALLTKQTLLAEAGVSGYASTQMCFDPKAITAWLRGCRSAGFNLPIHLGVPGVIDQAKLVTMGMRLGVGNSMRFLTKNLGAVTRMMTGYNPSLLIDKVAPSAEELGIEALHIFTFNAVDRTAAWQQRQPR